MNFKDYLPRIMANNRAAMRDCALSYRRDKKEGRVCFMVQWLILATALRNLNQGYQEAA
jgi:hypothetical protein